MNVTVPESGHDCFPGAVDHARLARDLDFTGLADRTDNAVGDDHHRVHNWSRIGRRIECAAAENECLRARWRDREADKAKENSSAEPNSDHVQSPLCHANAVNRRHLSG